mmetsp:Transcript_46002/g.144117  ORF Transcript_46002/g.144117 Transcript_46002/m.144117 type:complete len:216 (-) Transcript_46002:16-663(-)
MPVAGLQRPSTGPPRRPRPAARPRPHARAQTRGRDLGPSGGPRASGSESWRRRRGGRSHPTSASDRRGSRCPRTTKARRPPCSLGPPDRPRRARPRSWRCRPLGPSPGRAPERTCASSSATCRRPPRSRQSPCRRPARAPQSSSSGPQRDRWPRGRARSSQGRPTGGPQPCPHAPPPRPRRRRQSPRQRRPQPGAAAQAAGRGPPWPTLGGKRAR